MSEISDVLKRGKYKSVIAHISNAIEDDQENIRAFDQAISISYDTFLKELKQLYPWIDETENNLFDIISKFACTHDDIYFEAGVLVGFHLYQELQEHYRLHASSDLLELLK